MACAILLMHLPLLQGLFLLATLSDYLEPGKPFFSILLMPYDFSSLARCNDPFLYGVALIMMRSSNPSWDKAEGKSESALRRTSSKCELGVSLLHSIVFCKFPQLKRFDKGLCLDGFCVWVIICDLALGLITIFPFSHRSSSMYLDFVWPPVATPVVTPFMSLGCLYYASASVAPSMQWTLYFYFLKPTDNNYIFGTG